MGKIYLLSTGLLALLLTACNPRVMTDIMISHDPLPADSVHVFDVGETAPNSAEAIGKVAVVDAGFTTRCKYDQILQLAKEETGQAGGNGLLLITHLKPSFWGSSCHQIEGMMLFLHDMNIDSLAPNPVMRGVETMEAIRKEKERKENKTKEKNAEDNLLLNPPPLRGEDFEEMREEENSLKSMADNNPLADAAQACLPLIP